LVGGQGFFGYKRLLFKSSVKTAREKGWNRVKYLEELKGKAERPTA